jgi:hypothetical protein
MNPIKNSTSDTQCSKMSKLPKYQQPEAVRLGSQLMRGHAAPCVPGSSATAGCGNGATNVGGACNPFGTSVSA